MKDTSKQPVAYRNSYILRASHMFITLVDTYLELIDCVNSAVEHMKLNLKLFLWVYIYISARSIHAIKSIASVHEIQRGTSYAALH